MIGKKTTLAAACFVTLLIGAAAFASTSATRSGPVTTVTVVRSGSAGAGTAQSATHLAAWATIPGVGIGASPLATSVRVSGGHTAILLVRVSGQFSCQGSNTAGDGCYVRVLIDGHATPVAPSAQRLLSFEDGLTHSVAADFSTTPLAGGTHTVEAQWLVKSGGLVTADSDQLEVIESRAS